MTCYMAESNTHASFSQDDDPLPWPKRVLPSVISQLPDCDTERYAHTTPNTLPLPHTDQHPAVVARPPLVNLIQRPHPYALVEPA